MEVMLVKNEGVSFAHMLEEWTAGNGSRTWKLVDYSNGAKSVVYASREAAMRVVEASGMTDVDETPLWYG